MTIAKKSRKDHLINDILEQDKLTLGVPQRYKYKLTRESDGLVKRGNAIQWISFKPDGSFDKAYKKPRVGTSLLLDPRIAFTWLTTTVTEIFFIKKDRIRFKTKNSIYLLEILK